jgi:putative intracellular protease/amidase
MKGAVLVPLPDRDFDVTEVAVPWKLLAEAGREVVFATEEGATPAPSTACQRVARPLTRLPSLTDSAKRHRTRGTGRRRRATGNASSIARSRPPVPRTLRPVSFSGAGPG